MLVSYRAEDSIQSKGPWTLATLIHTMGSCYQKAGAQLVLSKDKQVFGLISGGCLENTIIEACIETKDKVHHIELDSLDPRDRELGYSVGCQGKLWVLIEIIHSKEMLVSRLNMEKKEDKIEIVCLDSQEHAKRDEFILGRELGSDLAGLRPILEKCWKQKKTSELITDNECLKYALIYRPAIIEISLFGLSPSSWPLIEVFQTMGWKINLFDYRESLLEASKMRFKNLNIQYLDYDRPEIFFVSNPNKSAAIVMTHNYPSDRKILKKLVTKNWSYIGLMGSAKRCLELRSELDIHRKIYAPIGLDLGANRPETIALSIAAEIEAHFQNKTAPQLLA